LYFLIVHKPGGHPSFYGEIQKQSVNLAVHPRLNLGLEKKINISHKSPQEVNSFSPKRKPGEIGTKQGLIFPLNEGHFLKI